jgi:hypothetical protein
MSINGTPSKKENYLKAKIDRLQKIIGKQTVYIEIKKTDDLYQAKIKAVSKMVQIGILKKSEKIEKKWDRRIILFLRF